MTNVLKFPAMTVKLDRWPNRIRELRDSMDEGRGWTQAQLGEMVGLTNVMVSHLEAGRRTLTIDHMRSFARAFGVDPVDILSKEDNPLILDDQAKDLMRMWPHVDEAQRQALQTLAESAAKFRAQPAILDFPGGDAAKDAKKKKDRDAA